METSLSEQYLWVDKYRPMVLDDMILNPNYKQTFQSWIDNNEIPNVLFVGTPGSGKTTLARILVDNIIKNKESDLLFLNGSTQRGIGIVKEQIEEFLRTIIFGESKIKIVFIDEFDFMTGEAQGALRHIIEAYSNVGRFILTANYGYKITSAIQSRMQIFKFKELPKEYIQSMIEKILKSENVVYKDPSIITKVITELYPDVRQIIGKIQSMCQNGALTDNISDLQIVEKNCRSLFNDILTYCVNKDFKNAVKTVHMIQELLKNVEPDFHSIYSEIFDDPNVIYDVKPKIVDYLDKSQNCIIPRMNFMAFLYDVVRMLRDRSQMIKG